VECGVVMGTLAYTRVRVGYRGLANSPCLEWSLASSTCGVVLLVYCAWRWRQPGPGLRPSPGGTDACQYWPWPRPAWLFLRAYCLGGRGVGRGVTLCVVRCVLRCQASCYEECQRVGAAERWRRPPNIQVCLMRDRKACRIDESLW
jgi:hypothetical protein